ncbi:MAG: hypothetical protein GY711_14305 [bacterium]|nr:hypothetical protein [bacterium]
MCSWSRLSAVLPCLLAAPLAAQTTWCVDVTGTPPGSGTQNDPYTSIDFAIAQPATQGGDTVLVAPGTYFEAIDLRGKGLLLRSTDGPESTVLDGGTTRTVVTIANGEPPSLTIEGFTIQHGNAVEGGGVFIEDAAARFYDCVITDNYSVTRGGGVLARNSSVLFGRCAIVDNPGDQFVCAPIDGGGLHAAGGNVVLEECMIAGNVAANGGGTFGPCTVRRSVYINNLGQFGGGASGAASISDSVLAENWGAGYTGEAGFGGGAYQSTLERCFVFDNNARDGGGLLWCTATDCTIAANEVYWHNRDTASPQGGGAANSSLTRCEVYANRANGIMGAEGLGGGVFGGAALECVIYDNEAWIGGGTHETGLVRSTVTRNSASVLGGGAWSGDVSTSILWGNAPDSLDGPLATAVYSDVQGGWPGLGNLDVDPMFWDTVASDFHLRAGSPCIDAGDPALFDPDATRADMGALPFDPNNCEDAETKLVAAGTPGAELGTSVDFDEQWVLAGAQEGDGTSPGSGVAVAFGRPDGAFPGAMTTLAADDGAAGDQFGRDVDLDWPLAVVGAPRADAPGQDAGAVYVFDSFWPVATPAHKLTGSDSGPFDEFGVSVSIDGYYLCAGAHQHNANAGAAYVFTNFGSINEMAKLVGSDTAAGDQFGVSVSLSGDRLAVGAVFDDNASGANAGAVYLFHHVQGQGWIEEAKLTASDGAGGDFFGVAVTLSGDKLLVGAEGVDDHGNVAGAAYVFELVGGTWTEVAKLFGDDLEAGDIFGNAVDLDGDRAIVSARGDDDRGADAGAAYVFLRIAGTWTQEHKLLPSPGAAGDEFSTSVGVNGSWTLVGATADDDGGNGAGAVYLAPNDFADCNGNLIADSCDIASGRSTDFDGDGVPDECQPSIGSTYCSPNANNSTGQPAEIRAIGSDEVLDLDLALVATNLPPDQFGYFLTSQTQGFIAMPGGSQGNICLGGSIGRFNSLSQIFQSGHGVGGLVVDLTQMPVSPPVPVMAGETWNFQAWYRDLNPGSTSNFTDAVSVAFQ